MAVIIQNSATMAFFTPDRFRHVPVLVWASRGEQTPGAPSTAAKTLWSCLRVLKFSHDMFLKPIERMKIIHVWHMQSPSSSVVAISFIHQWNWPFWSRMIEPITMTIRGKMREERRGMEGGDVWRKIWTTFPYRRLQTAPGDRERALSKSYGSIVPCWAGGSLISFLPQTVQGL